MYAVIFEVEPKDDKQAARYFELAAQLRPELEKIDGFISIERFQSVTNKGKFVSLSFWRDEAALIAWRAQMGHQMAQREGKESVFKDYRIRVAEVVRDYNLAERRGKRW